jgi:hypothetical protein
LVKERISMKTLGTGLCIFLLLAAATAILAVSYYRVLVVEAISRVPIPGAYITLERSSGPSEETGQTDANGRLAFWNAPLPLPRHICAQSTFYPPACVGAIGFGQRIIQLAVPSGAP